MTISRDETIYILLLSDFAIGTVANPLSICGCIKLSFIVYLIQRINQNRHPVLSIISSSVDFPQECTSVFCDIY